MPLSGGAQVLHRTDPDRAPLSGPDLDR